MAKPVKVVVLGDSKDARKAFKDIRDEANETQGPLASFGEKLGGFASAAAGVALGVGGAISGLFVKGFLDGMEAERLNDKLAAQLGLSGPEAEEAGRIATEVYRDAWGESLAEVNDAIKGIENAMGGLSNFSEDETRSMVEDALTIADVWDQDVNEVIRAAGALMDSDLADSADHAFDIIATGLQEGIDLNGDFLDTLFEYSTFFEGAGISADKMLAGLIAGTDAGMMGVDKVGDAVKEMGVIIQENAEPAQQALEDLGLDAGEISTAFAKGGDSAEDATQRVLEGLASMEDPIAQHNAAVTLLGVPYEDLGEAGPEVLQALVDGTVEVIDTTEVAETAYDNLATSIEEFKREGLGAVQTFVAGALVAFGVGGEDGSLKSGIDDINTWIEENQEQIEEWGEEFGTFILEATEGAQEFADSIRPIIEHLDTALDVINFINDALRVDAEDNIFMESVAKAAKAILNPLGAVLDAIKEIKSALGGGFGKTIGGGGGKGGVDLPVYHDGGVVPGSPGQEVPILAMAGETVVPAGAEWGTNVIVNVSGSVVTERELVDVVHDGLLRKGRRTPLGLG